MGDYCKLIVSCSVKAESRKELEAKIEGLSLCTSSYQSGERIISIEDDPHRGFRGPEINVIIIGQTKYGRGQHEFCEWLRPHVTQASGENDVYAMSFSEYSDMPTFWKMRDACVEDTP